jgi:5-aminolevulinate synthase
VIEGTLAKGFGCARRLYRRRRRADRRGALLRAGFIFTTALPPASRPPPAPRCAPQGASGTQWERDAIRRMAAITKHALGAAGLPVLENPRTSCR